MRRICLQSMVLIFILMMETFLCASISLSPSLFELKIPGGKSFTDSIRLINVGHTTVEINVYLSDFDLNSDGNINFYEPGTTKYSLSNHLRVNPTSFNLEPGEERWVRFTLSVPKDLKGEIQGILFFQTIPKKIRSPKGKQIMVSARIGATIYAAPKQAVKAGAEILDILIKRVPGELSYIYTLLVQNNGNIHIRPKGKLKILNLEGKSIITTKINKKNSSVLRNSLRIFRGEFKGKLNDGDYRIVADIDYGKAVFEAEKSIYISSKLKIESFNVKYISKKESKNASRIKLAAEIKCLNKEIKNLKKLFRLKTKTGKLVAEIPVIISRIKGKIFNFALKGEWKEELKPGIYFAELLVYMEKIPITSYCKLIVK